MIKQAVEDLLKVHKLLGDKPEPVSAVVKCIRFSEDTCEVHDNLLDIVINSGDDNNTVVLNNETATELAVALLQGVLSGQFE